MKSATSTRFGIVAVALAAAGAMMIALAGPAWGAGPDETDQCRGAWDDAPASSVCTSTRIVGWKRATRRIEVYCTVEGVACSVSATDADGDTVTWVPSFGTVNQSMGDTESLDVCFNSNSQGLGGYLTYLRSGCESGEITSATMDGSTLE